MFVGRDAGFDLGHFSMPSTSGPASRRIKCLGAAVLANDRKPYWPRPAVSAAPSARAAAEDGIEHMDHPKELVEEIMYESVLETKLKLQRLLPLVAIIAAAACPWAVGHGDGIITLFKMITVFGTGDPKTLSGT